MPSAACAGVSCSHPLGSEKIISMYSMSWAPKKDDAPCLARTMSFVRAHFDIVPADDRTKPRQATTNTTEAASNNPITRVEHARAPWVGQRALQRRAEGQPQQTTRRGCSCKKACHPQRPSEGRVTGGRAVGGRRTGRDDPRLRIDPLKSQRPPKAHRLGARAVSHRRGTRNLPGQPEQQRRATPTQCHHRGRQRGDHATQAERGGTDQQRHAGHHASQAGQATDKPGTRAGGQHHHVARPGRDRRHQREHEESRHRIECHRRDSGRNVRSSVRPTRRLERSRRPGGTEQYVIGAGGGRTWRRTHTIALLGRRS